MHFVPILTEQANVCVPLPCANGDCFESENDYTCICYDGWQGANCDGTFTLFIIFLS